MLIVANYILDFHHHNICLIKIEEKKPKAAITIFSNLNYNNIGNEQSIWYAETTITSHI